MVHSAPVALAKCTVNKVNGHALNQQQPAAASSSQQQPAAASSSERGDDDMATTTWRAVLRDGDDEAKNELRIHCTNKMLAPGHSAQTDSSDRAQPQSHVVDMNRLVP